jgi:hypothetical protein
VAKGSQEEVHLHWHLRQLGQHLHLGERMTTKYPITLIPMEVSEQLRSRGMEMSVT